VVRAGLLGKLGSLGRGSLGLVGLWLSEAERPEAFIDIFVEGIRRPLGSTYRSWTRGRLGLGFLASRRAGLRIILGLVLNQGVR